MQRCMWNAANLTGIWLFTVTMRGGGGCLFSQCECSGHWTRSREGCIGSLYDTPDSLCSVYNLPSGFSLTVAVWVKSGQDFINPTVSSSLASVFFIPIEDGLRSWPKGQGSFYMDHPGFRRKHLLAWFQFIHLKGACVHLLLTLMVQTRCPVHWSCTQLPGFSLLISAEGRLCIYLTTWVQFTTISNDRSGGSVNVEESGLMQ